MLMKVPIPLVNGSAHDNCPHVVLHDFSQLDDFAHAGDRMPVRCSCMQNSRSEASLVSGQAHFNLPLLRLKTVPYCHAS